MCSNKKNGFQGKATNPESRNIKDGQTVVENKLVADAVPVPRSTLGRSPQTETPMIQDPGGDRVMVLDLPENWKDEEFRDLISTTSSDEE